MLGMKQEGERFKTVSHTTWTQLNGGWGLLID